MKSSPFGEHHSGQIDPESIKYIQYSSLNKPEMPSPHLTNRPLIAAPSPKFLQDIVLDSNRDLPLHAQLRTALQRLIEERFLDNGKFYSESQLISSLKISQGTVRRALTDLAHQGLLEKHQARSTVVRKHSTVSSIKNLSVFLPDYSSQNGARFLSSISEECLNRGINVHPIYTHRGEHLLKAYDSLKFAAHEGWVMLLENSPRATTELAAALQGKGYNYVVIDTLTTGTSNKFVGTSNRAMMEIGLAHLVDLGHRRITLLVNEPEEKESVQQRIAAFQSWSSRCVEPLVARVAYSGTQLWDDAYVAAQKVMKEIMTGGEPPTAILAISDVGALGAIRWLQQQGLRVPEDISVMGTDGLALGEIVHPALTTLACPVKEITAAAFHLLSGDRESRELIFQPKLLVRDSTSRPHFPTGSGTHTPEKSTSP